MDNFIRDTLSLFETVPNTSKGFCEYLLPCGYCKLRNMKCDIPYDTRVEIIRELHGEDDNINEDTEIY